MSLGMFLLLTLEMLIATASKIQCSDLRCFPIYSDHLHVHNGPFHFEVVKKNDGYGVGTVYVGIAHAHARFPTAVIFFTSVYHQNFAFSYQRLLILQEQRETNVITHDQCNFSCQSHTSTSGS